MTKRKTVAAEKFVNPADAVVAARTPETSPSLQPVMLLITETDFRDMKEHFAQGKTGEKAYKTARAQPIRPPVKQRNALTSRADHNSVDGRNSVDVINNQRVQHDASSF